MAKMFYTLDEAKAALGKNEDEIKQLAREGRLREFRDGPRLMFKADQVETLKSEIGGGAGSGQVDLGPSDSGMAIGLADSKGSGVAGIGSGAAAMEAGSGQLNIKEDTALAADLGLSGSVGGVPSPSKPASVGTGLSGTSQSRAGVDVFQNDDVERVDPSAQTAISPGITEQTSLEGGVGSGSGLLDLTREKDDTSLGAVLDEIAPSGSMAGQTRRAETTGAGSMMAAALTDARTASAASNRGGAVIEREAADPLAGAFGAAALGAVIAVILGAFALVAGVLDTQPELLDKLGHSFLELAGGAVAIVLVFFIGGFVASKATAR